MNNQQNPLTLPDRRLRRTRSLNLRLTEQEKASVERLAQMQGVSASTLARHFLMQAVAFYSKQQKMHESEAQYE